jgi:peroxiredoxin Q/BCP
MAQLRLDYQKFVERDAVILAVGPDGPKAFQRFWESEKMPFTGLSDVGNATAKQYFQEYNLLKFGWVPALFIVDKTGMIRFSHYGESMSDIPENNSVLAMLDEINASK